MDALRGDDRYFLCADFAAYEGAQRRAALAYARPEVWWRSSILNVAGAGKFSSDRATRQYAEEIWGVVPAPVRMTGEVPPSVGKTPGRERRGRARARHGRG